MKNFQVLEDLKKLYKQKVLHFEKKFKYDIFYFPQMSDAEFDSKPHVLIIGQYSVGKTTLIKQLLGGQKYPDMKIGPEPSTDKFVAVMHGDGKSLVTNVTPGNVLAVSDTSSYNGLERFGISFLNQFVGVYVNSELLKEITFIDTPGVLAGDKSKDQKRGYNFSEVTTWFASRADLILLMFDFNKVTIPDELKEVIDACKANGYKIRFILNKAVKGNSEELRRTYGALMWYLGKVIERPEVPRIYLKYYDTSESQQANNISSPQAEESSAEVMDESFIQGNGIQLAIDEEDLIKELRELPKKSVIKKIDDLVKRIRMLRVHASLLSYLREEMPIFGQAAKKAELIQNLDTVYNAVAIKYNLPLGDFPNKKEFQAKLEGQEFCLFEKFTPNMMKDLNAVLEQEIPKLMIKLLQGTTNAVNEEDDGLRDSLGTNHQRIHNGSRTSNSNNTVPRPPTATTMQWMAEGAASMLPHWLKSDQMSKKSSNNSTSSHLESTDLNKTLSDSENNNSSEGSANPPISHKRNHANKVSSTSTASTTSNHSAIFDEGSESTIRTTGGMTDEDFALNVSKKVRLFK